MFRISQLIAQNILFDLRRVKWIILVHSRISYKEEIQPKSVFVYVIQISFLGETELCTANCVIGRCAAIDVARSTARCPALIPDLQDWKASSVATLRFG